MASIQRFTSGGNTYWRIVESYRRADGKPAIRMLMYLGKPEALLERLQQLDRGLHLRSVSSGAVDALYRLGTELGISNIINATIKEKGNKPQVRDRLSVGESLLFASIARLCHPSSKRAIAEWAQTTTLPIRFGVEAAALTSQHFWDQMHAMPVSAVALAEEQIVKKVLQVENLSAAGLLAYDTTNFFTFVDSTNQRTTLAQRGHNKNGRHDLRQLGLALVVSEQGQIPLAHTLYQGARADVRTFQDILAPLRRRLDKLVAQSAQMTLVFDQGAESAANLDRVREEGTHYVTALKPSHHRKWLAEVSSQLAPVALSTGEKVKALITRRPVHGVDQTVVALWSENLYEGQCRGLKQDLARALRELAKMSPHPRGGIAGARDRVKRICNRQYLRQVLHCDITEDNGKVTVKPHIDQAKIEQLQQKYFGLRVLATSREDWSPAQIIEAYRGQARVERAFRDLKDPWVGALRPQFHWTDQKLTIHTFMAVLGLTLGRLLLLRAEKAGFRGSVRTLIQRLETLRTATILQQPEATGKPRVREQLEDCSPELRQLGLALGAIAP
jgi:transposase